MTLTFTCTSVSERQEAANTPRAGRKARMAGVRAGVLVGEEKVRVMTSPTLKPTTRGGGLDALAATSPGQHVTAPAPLSSGGVHGVQAEGEGAARAALKVPGGHGVQAAWEVVPVELE